MKKTQLHQKKSAGLPFRIFVVILFVAAFFSCSYSTAQNNYLVINNAKIVLNGGTFSDPIYLVANQSHTDCISKLGTGYIISEGDNNFV